MASPNTSDPLAQALAQAQASERQSLSLLSSLVLQQRGYEYDIRRALFRQALNAAEVQRQERLQKLKTLYDLYASAPLESQRRLFERAYGAGQFPTKEELLSHPEIRTALAEYLGVPDNFIPLFPAKPPNVDLKPVYDPWSKTVTYMSEQEILQRGTGGRIPYEQTLAPAATEGEQLERIALQKISNYLAGQLSFEDIKDDLKLLLIRIAEGRGNTALADEIRYTSDDEQLRKYAAFLGILKNAQRQQQSESQESGQSTRLITAVGKLGGP